jgi:lipoate-protein ligase B
VTTELSAFDLIVPCGLRGACTTSLAALLGPPPAPLPVLAHKFAAMFAAVLGRVHEFRTDPG